jgi:hypothetical protein
MKIQGWEKILSEHIQEHSISKFEWGYNDCLCFVSEYSRKVTGKVPNELVWGKYRTKEEALQYYQSVTEQPHKTMDRFYNRVNLSFAQRGDIVLKYRDDGFTFGLIENGKAIFKTENGLTRENIKAMDYAWRVD